MYAVGLSATGVLTWHTLTIAAVRGYSCHALERGRAGVTLWRTCRPGELQRRHESGFDEPRCRVAHDFSGERRLGRFDVSDEPATVE